MRKSICILLAFLMLNCCKEKQKLAGIISIPSEGWAKGRPLAIDFSTGEAEKYYDFTYQVCYNSDYSFENIWINYCLANATGDTISLSTDNLFLFEPSSGRPIGKGTRERYYLNAYFIRNLKLPAKGRYKLILKQQMRSDKLKGLINFGVSITPES